MNMKRRRPFSEALAVAEDLVSLLAPSCERIAIAGSLRRRKPEVGDIELVAIPRARYDLFGEKIGYDDPTQGLDAVFTKRGEKYKQFTWQGMTVDLFLTTPLQWGIILAIRTGPGDFSRKLVTPRLYGGFLPPGFRCEGGWLWREEQRLGTPEEEDVFRLLGLAYIPPEQRA